AAESAATPAAPFPAPPAGPTASGHGERSVEAAMADKASMFDARLAREPNDVAWSRAKLLAIRDAIRASAPGTRVLAAECGSTLCRVQVDHDDADAQRTLGQALTRLDPFQSGVFCHYDRTALPPRTTLYVLREGASFADDGVTPAGAP